MRFQVLDGWRGICALLVALHHFQGDGHFFALPFVRNSYLFVDFFFVLSGFVIAHSTHGRMTCTADFTHFVRRRFARLWPLHVSVLAALVAVEMAKAMLMALKGIPADNAPFTGPNSLASLASNLALLHGLGLHDYATWNFPSWSISTEFATYLVFAALTLLMPGRMIWVAAAVAVGGGVIVAALSHEWLHTIADWGFFRCLYGFFAGVLIYRLHLSAKAAPPGPAWAWEAGAIALGIAFVTAAGKDALSMAAPLVFGLIVMVFAREAGPLSRLLSGEPIRRLGDWSYSIYLVHTLILVILGRALNAAEAMSGRGFFSLVTLDGEEYSLMDFGGPWATDAVALIYLAAVVVVARTTHRLIELPGQRLLNAAGRRPSVPAE